MKCNEIRELLSLYIDQMLDENVARDVEEHLSVCDACRKEYNDIKEIHKLLCEVEMIQVPESFELRLRSALTEEIQNMPVSGIPVKKSKIRSQSRLITSIAAVFIVGVLSFGLYKEVLGIFQEKLDGGDQAGATQIEELYGADDLETSSDDQDEDSAAGMNQVNDLASGAQTDLLVSGAGAVQTNIDGQEDRLQNNSDLKKKEAVLDEETDDESDQNSDDKKKTVYGLVNPELDIDTESEAETVIEQQDDAVSAKGGISSRKMESPKEECSRSLNLSGVERNAAAVQYYNRLIEERLEGFDYQVLDSSYTKTGEWQFRIFIFRGKDGNTYNEEILIIGKGGEIEIICSNELMGL